MIEGKSVAVVIPAYNEEKRIGDTIGSIPDFVDRIRLAMQPHVFNDTNPPDVKLAELGDLGGALGAALLARTRASRDGHGT